MDFQPNNCSDDVADNSFIDFDEMVFEGHAFYHQYNGLTFRQDGWLETPDLKERNPFIPSNSAPQIDLINDMLKKDTEEASPIDIEKWISSNNINDSTEQSSSLDAADQEAIALILEIEADAISKNQNVNRPATANQQQAIEANLNYLRSVIDRIPDFQVVINAMRYHNTHPVMTMGIQPVANQRFRYFTDGLRYLQGSKTSPMTIHLPILDDCLRRPSQSFWIQMTVVTTQHNPDGRVFIHQYAMFYNDENVHSNGLHSFRIPITNEEIHQRVKSFGFISIYKTKQQDYDFQLIPFDPLMPDDHRIYYAVDNEDQLTKVQKSKRFDDEYHTEELRIVSQLLIKENDDWYLTDVHCATHVITDG